MKTRIQWINSLPEEIRQRAISNIQEQLICPDWKETYLSLELCLKSSFVFEKTFEGTDVWEHVCTFNPERIIAMNRAEWDEYYKPFPRGQILLTKSIKTHE